MRLTIEEISEAVHSETPIDPSCRTAPVAGFTWDSREVKPGNLYVALVGERVDGHEFAQSAVQAGAAAVLASRDLDVEVPVIVVQDTQRALSDLAAYWRGRIAGTVIGLTGSTGKTTTKNLVRDVLAEAGSVVATLANQNNELGVPRTLLQAETDTAALVVEMGMRGAGQIAELCSIAKPDWGLITNVGESHIELLGTQDNIAHAKAELFEALPDGRGIAFVNAADPYAGELCRYARLSERGVSVVFFGGDGVGGDADGLGALYDGAPAVWASDVALDADGRPAFTMHARGFGSIGRDDADGACACALELRGIHNVSNACSAAAIGLAAGMSLSACVQALENARPERGRQQVLHASSGVTVVDDAYNANPDSMSASLKTFLAMDVSGRRIAVLGDMLELGDYAREAHERMGKLAARLGIDELICVGELSRFMADAAIGAGLPEARVRRCGDAAEALEAASSIVSAGDAVLVKASHSIGLEAIVEGLVG